MNGEESELANQVPDDGMIASATGMRARDPWEMERPMRRERNEVDAIGAELAAQGWRVTSQRGPDGWTAVLYKMEAVGVDDFFGSGATCLESIKAAVAERDAKVK